MKVDINKSESGLEFAFIELDGRLDAQQSDSIETKLMELIGQGYVNMIIDMKNVQYLGSSGIRVLLATLNKLNNEEGKLKILNISDTGLKILRTMEIINRFDMYDNREKAIEEF